MCKQKEKKSKSSKNTKFKIQNSMLQYIKFCYLLVKDHAIVKKISACQEYNVKLHRTIRKKY